MHGAARLRSWPAVRDRGLGLRDRQLFAERPVPAHELRLCRLPSERQYELQLLHLWSRADLFRFRGLLPLPVSFMSSIHEQRVVMRVVMRVALRGVLALLALAALPVGCGRTQSELSEPRATPPPAASASGSAPPLIVAASHDTPLSAPASSTSTPRTDDPPQHATPTPQASAQCPRLPLKNGDACKVRGECTYIDCAGPGRVTVRCNGSKANVEILPCSAFRCGGVGGIDCEGNTLCVERSSGYHDAKCISNPCGKGPLSCNCAGSLCEGASCTISGAIVHCGGGCKGCPQ